MMGFGAAAAYDMFMWKRCLEEPADVIEKEIQALQPQLNKSENALLAQVQKDFDQLERKRAASNPAKEEK